MAGMAAFWASRDGREAGLWCGTSREARGELGGAPSGPPTSRLCCTSALGPPCPGTDTEGCVDPASLPEEKAGASGNARSLIKGLRKRVRLGGQETVSSVCMPLMLRWFMNALIWFCCYPDVDQRSVLGPRSESPGRETESGGNGVGSVGPRPHRASQGNRRLTLPARWG